MISFIFGFAVCLIMPFVIAAKALFAALVITFGIIIALGWPLIVAAVIGYFAYLIGTWSRRAVHHV
jgi:hypothetical protein